MQGFESHNNGAEAQPLTAWQTAVGAFIVEALTMGVVWVWMITII